MSTVGSLFSGIGGLDLGLERAGWSVRWQVEVDPFCRHVLAMHWPDVSRFGDVTTLTGAELAPVDLIAGGFPCQPVSQIGARRAQDDAQWRWPEFIRLIRVLRPRLVFLENVTGLLGRGMGDVLGDLAESGYDAEWQCVSASALGAPHERDRVWIVAYPGGERSQGIFENWTTARATRRSRRASPRMDSLPLLRELPVHDSHDACVSVRVPFGGRMVDRPVCGPGPWSTGPRVFRMVTRTPARMDRLRALGNAVVPEVAEWIGRRLLAVM
jgi:DNA (cytosine-5)-methyltransferase 1